jgi:hypothetical protein
VKRLISLAVVAATVAGGIAVTDGGSSAAAAGSAGASGLPQLTVALNHTSINVGGALQSGAVDVTTTTTNERQGNPTFVHLNPGVTAQQAQAFIQSPAANDPNNISKIGSIVFSAQVNSGTGHVNTTLPPGNYVALDINGNNPASFPHTSFTVQQASQPAALPTPQATLKAIDFAFRGPRTLHDGQLLQVENDGFVAHMITAIGAKNAKSAAQIAKLLRAGKDNKAQRLAVGAASFQSPVSPGAVQQLKLDAKPGFYVLACFMDTQDGREHTRIGMERVIQVKKQ